MADAKKIPLGEDELDAVSGGVGEFLPSTTYTCADCGKTYQQGNILYEKIMKKYGVSLCFACMNIRDSSGAITRSSN